MRERTRRAGWCGWDGAAGHALVAADAPPREQCATVKLETFSGLLRRQGAAAFSSMPG